MKRVALGAVVAIAYAWWAAGVAPFSALAYGLVAAPCLVAVAAFAGEGGFSTRRHDLAAHYRSRAAGATIASAAPWLSVLGAALALEVWGLVLGGRSAAVPTLSTVVDHLLATRVERAILYVLWLAVGALPVAGLARRGARTDR